MPFTPDQPYPKKQGDNIRSKDWNDAVEEIKRLDTAKLNLAGGGHVNGPLSVAGNVGVGTAAPAFGLQVGDIEKVGSLKLCVAGRGSTGNWRQWTLRTGDGGSPADIHKLRIRDEQAGADRVVVDENGNVGVGMGDPRCKLDVAGGTANVWADTRHAVPSNFMAPGSLTIGSTSRNYGGGTQWNSNTAGLLLEAQDNTEIAVHDSGTRVASLMYYEGAHNRVTVGRDMGWGPLSTVYFTGRLGLGMPDPGYRLDVSGRIRLRQGADGSAGLWLLQTGPGNDRAFIGMQSDTSVGFWGNTGAQWGLVMDTGTGDVTIPSTLKSSGRMHINPGEILYLLPKSGVTIGKEWGGTGDLRVQGDLSIGNWTITAEGNSLFFKRGGFIVARLSTDWDRLMVFKNVNGRAPYFFFNQEGGSGVYNG